MTFGDRIRSNRIKNNMSQQELADLLNVTPQTISKWENDLSEPGFQMITRMTEIFKITHDDLFIGDTDILYKGSIYTAVKDFRMKRYYDFFLAFFAFLSLSLLITAIYISTVDVLPWFITLVFGLFAFLLLIILFTISRWRNIYSSSLDKLLDVYLDRIIINDGDLTIEANRIEKIVIKKYSFYSGIRVYDDTGYLKIWTKDNQTVVTRDINEISNLRKVIFKIKHEGKKEENQ